jgi:transcriptional regulator with XRE-family HTH domain
VHRSRPTQVTLGTVLRVLRKEHAWTQEKLSLKTGLTTATISNTENGKHNLSFDSIERWLNALGVTWAEFGDAMQETARR